MKRITRIAVFLLCVSAALAAQATVAGKWEGKTDNNMPISLQLAVKDGGVTGTLTRSGRTSPITDGKLVKNSLTFKAVLGSQTESFTGLTENGGLRIWLDRQGPSKAVVLKRGT